MKFTTRREEFAYFLGFVARTQARVLREAEEWFVEKGYSTFMPESVFEVCPYNDSAQKILRGYEIFERGKRDELGSRIIGLMGEYLFLVSDFVPSCCGDGRTFYEKTSEGDIVLGCDRCGSAYSLDERLVRTGLRMRMGKFDFEGILGGDTVDDWPNHKIMRKLLNEET